MPRARSSALSPPPLAASAASSAPPALSVKRCGWCKHHHPAWRHLGCLREQQQIPSAAPLPTGRVRAPFVSLGAVFLLLAARGALLQARKRRNSRPGVEPHGVRYPRPRGVPACGLQPCMSRSDDYRSVGRSLRGAGGCRQRHAGPLAPCQAPPRSSPASAPPCPLVAATITAQLVLGAHGGERMGLFAGGVKRRQAGA